MNLQSVITIITSIFATISWLLFANKKAEITKLEAENIEHQINIQNQVRNDSIKKTVGDTSFSQLSQQLRKRKNKST